MKILGTCEYPEDWETSFLGIGKISIHFGYASSGWILLSVIAGCNQSLTLHLSYVYDPFSEMVDWLNMLADGDLPAILDIDEEGIQKRLIVRSYEGRYSESADVEFRIAGDYWDDDAKEYKKGTHLLVRTKRLQLLSEFTRRLDQWLNEDYEPKEWDRYGLDEGAHPDIDLRKLDIKGLKSKVKKLLH